VATLDAVFIPSNDQTSASLGATTSTAEIVVGKNRIVMISAGVDMTVKFGISGMTAAAITDIPVWAKTYQRFDTGEYDRIRIFNVTAGAGQYYIVPLVK
jgi:hypothetical protein